MYTIDLFMTKLSKSGVMNKNRHHESRKIEDHTGDTFVTKDGQWHGQEVAVNSDPLIDPGTGRPIFIRTFEFSKSPDFDQMNPSKQELFNAHAQQLSIFLWKDGLAPVQAIEPKIIFSKDKYTIFVTCQAKPGVAVLDNPLNLQDLMKTNGPTQRDRD
jgi:hypothetical protein